jgi:DNA-binding NarL/FixJ family response regulator
MTPGTTLEPPTANTTLTGAGPEVPPPARAVARPADLVHAAIAGTGAAAVVDDAGSHTAEDLDGAAELASGSGAVVIRLRGITTEQHLPYAGLHRLLDPLGAAPSGLPAPQRAALGRVFGFSEGRGEDHLLIGIATLTMLTVASAGRPLFVVVEDAHRLDEATRAVVGFVARRVHGRAVALLIAGRRDIASDPAFAGVDVLHPVGRAGVRSEPPSDEPSHAVPTVTARPDPLETAAWLGDTTVRPVCASLLGRHGAGTVEWEVATRALVTLDLAGGDYDAALRGAVSLAAAGGRTSDLVDVVEAGMRSHVVDDALSAVAELESRSRSESSARTTGLLALVRALVADGDEARPDYVRAIDVLATADAPRYAARAHLLHGEWLRRRKRRAEARIQLAAAHDLFVAMGATGFADRAARELVATGATVRRRDDEHRHDLTVQERRIAQLAAAHLTNKEIAHQLFLSPRTIEYHLHNIFQKLSITSRRELGGAGLLERLAPTG